MTKKTARDGEVYGRKKEKCSGSLCYIDDNIDMYIVVVVKGYLSKFVKTK